MYLWLFEICWCLTASYDGPKPLVKDSYANSVTGSKLDGIERVQSKNGEDYLILEMEKNK